MGENLIVSGVLPSGARNEFIGIEHLTDMQVEANRQALEEDFAMHPRGHRRADSVNRLLARMSGAQA